MTTTGPAPTIDEARIVRAPRPAADGSIVDIADVTDGEPTEPFAWSGCTSIAAERRHRRERLAAGFRLLAHHGLDEGVAGHLTVRDPGRPDHFWVNPFGMAFRKIRVSDLQLVDRAGEVAAGGRAINVSAFAICTRPRHPTRSPTTTARRPR